MSNYWHVFFLQESSSGRTADQGWIGFGSRSSEKIVLTSYYSRFSSLDVGSSRYGLARSLFPFFSLAVGDAFGVSIWKLNDTVIVIFHFNFVIYFYSRRCIIGAVAPAVVVPCLFRLRNKGYGVVKGIPTLIIAVAGINDGLSVAFFGLFHSIMFSHRKYILEFIFTYEIAATYRSSR